MKKKKLVAILTLATMLSTSSMSVFASDLSDAEDNLKNLQTSQSVATNEINEITDKLKAKADEVAKVDVEINELNSEYTLVDNEFKKLVRDDYNLSNKFGSATAYMDLVQLEKETKEKAEEYKNEITDLNNKKETLNSEKELIEKSKTESEKKLKDINSQVDAAQSKVDEIKKAEEAAKAKEEARAAAQTQTSNPTWNGSVLSASAGVNYGPSGKETYYNLDMSGVVSIMRGMGNNDEYWVRADGCKMLGNYIMVAANLSVHPRGSLVETSLGTGIVCDTGGFASGNANQLDIATTW